MMKTLLFAAVALTVGTASAVERNLTMYLPFDGTAEAEIAAGAKAPVASGGLEFGPGRFGKAVRLTEKAKSVLAYAAKGNLDWKRGTMSFWLKRDALGGSRPRPRRRNGSSSAAARGRTSCRSRAGSTR